MAGQVKPPFAYYGGKTTLAEKIADLLPPHEHYVEPFAGSLAVLLAKEPSRIETVNDLDGDLVTFWRVLRDMPDELAQAAAHTPHSRAELLQASNLEELDDLERARRVWVRLTQSRSHSMQQSGWWRATKTTRDIPRSQFEFASRIQPTARRLRLVSLECRDATELVRDYGDSPEVCIYADPPYLGTTRATNYRQEMTTDQQHADLADALNSCKATVVLSGYDSPLYAELFAGWHVTRLKAPTTLSGDTDRMEVLWSNRPIGEPDLFGESA